MINSLYDFCRSWSARGSVYILSDTHFDDPDTKLMDENWISPKEQLDILKKFIHKCDTFIHLGDVGNPEYLKSLPGHKVLILGNHDESRKRFENYFDEIYTGPLIISKKIILSHEPVDVPWAFNIHGHDHNRRNTGDDLHLNLAANVCGYTPVNLGMLIKNGLVANVKSIHRLTIDDARENGALK